MRTFARLAILAAILVVGRACLADDYEDGRALYKANKFAEAAAKFEHAVQQNPNDAKSWWQLNFAYHKLNRDSDALKAVQKAGQADPQHSFASEHGKYEQILAQRQKESGPSANAPRTASPSGGTPENTGETTAGSGSGTLVQQLVNGDVYVEHGMRVDVDKLRQTAATLRPTVVKFAIFNSNSGSAQLAREADRIRKYLKGQINQGQGYVIAASRRGVAVSSTSISKSDLKQLTDQVAPAMEAGSYTDALANLAKGLARERAPRASSTQFTPNQVPVVQHGPNWFVIFLVGIGVVVVVWLIVRSISSRTAMTSRRDELEREKSQVISGMSYLEENAIGVDDRAAAQIREARVAAGTKLDEASRLMQRAGSDMELQRAQTLLDQAQADISRGRSILDRVLRGEPAVAASPVVAGAAAAPGAAPPVYSQTQSGAPPVADFSTVPDTEKGVCFFCSKPAYLRDLTPVTVNLNGQQQKVLACYDDLQTIKSGAMPQIRAFNVNNQYVPWYAYQNYNPYNDYYRPGFWDNAGSFAAGMVTMNLIDDMFWNWRRPVGWGWGGGYGGGWGNTYNFYPDHEYYRDYYGGQAAGHSDFSDVDRTDTAAGTDFLGSTGGDTGGSDIGSDRS